MMRFIYILLLSIFYAVGGYAQVMQTTGGAGGNKFKAVKADTMLIAPFGSDTANIGWTKWGVSTTGALFVKTADSSLWYRINNKWHKLSGTVTTFSSGNLSPLFTTSVATATTTPALSFSLSNAGAYTVFGNQTNASAAPSFAKMNINTIDATGTPSATTYLRGDGSWAAAGGSSAVNYIAGDSSYVGVDAGVGGNGTDAGPSNAFNFFLGQKAGMNNVYGKSIVAMGRRALETFVGQNVAATDTTGIIAIGNYALYKYVSNAAKSDVNSGAVAIGPFSQYNTTSPTTDNTSIGLRSLFTNTTGAGNTAIGVRTLQANLTGSSNTAIGDAAMRDNTASNNVAIGANAMTAKTSGSRNVAIGGEAMSGATAPGDGNVAVGDQSLSSASLTGSDNTAMGRGAGSAITSGSSNIVLTAGWLSGSVTSGSGNIVLASNFSGGTAPTSGSRNVYIGDRPSIPSATANDQLAIGMNNVNWFISDLSGTHRRWTLQGNNTNYTANTAGVTLDIRGVEGGFRRPQVTTTQRNAITAATGNSVYNTDLKTNDVYDGTRWVQQPNGLSGSATLDFGNTAAQSSADLTITVTGAADGDIVIVGPVNASTNANSCFTAWVSAANTVTVRFNNYSAAAIDPASGTFKVYVIKN